MPNTSPLSLETLLRMYSSHSVALENLKRLHQLLVTDTYVVANTRCCVLIYWALMSASDQLNARVSKDLSDTVRALGYEGTREIWIDAASDIATTRKELKRAGFIESKNMESDVDASHLGAMALFSDLVQPAAEEKMGKRYTVSQTFSHYSDW